MTQTQTHTYHVKNMVCRRCILIVTEILNSIEVEAVVSAGKILVKEKLPGFIQDELSKRLNQVGLEIIESRVKRLTEEVKSTVIEYLSLGYESQRFKLSGYISSKLSYDFTYLSELFSKSEGITIERYFLLQRLEKVKELMVYDELSLSEICL